MSDQDKMREDFEAWAIQEAPGHSVKKDEAGDYIEYATHCAWRAWQAAWNRRPLATQAAEPVGALTDAAMLDFAQTVDIDGGDNVWYVGGRTYFGVTLREAITAAMQRGEGERT